MLSKSGQQLQRFTDLKRVCSQFDLTSIILHISREIKTMVHRESLDIAFDPFVVCYFWNQLDSKFTYDYSFIYRWHQHWLTIELIASAETFCGGRAGTEIYKQYVSTWVQHYGGHSLIAQQHELTLTALNGAQQTTRITWNTYSEGQIMSSADLCDELRKLVLARIRWVGHIHYALYSSSGDYGCFTMPMLCCLSPWGSSQEHFLHKFRVYA